MNRSSYFSTLGRVSLLVLTLCLIATILIFSRAGHQTKVLAQTTLGSPLPGLTMGQMDLFTVGFKQFNVHWDPDHGLGPIYTNQDCSNCHMSPASGGTSTMRTTFFGALNSDGSFNPLTSEGGFVLQPQTIQHFVKGCLVVPEVVPRDATLMSQRVPPQLFGFGLIDSIADSTIENFAGNKGMGVNGTYNLFADWIGLATRRRAASWLLPHRSRRRAIRHRQCRLLYFRHSVECDLIASIRAPAAPR